MHVIAEGAETKAQVDFLKSNNCNEVQGFFYSKPLVEEELLVFLYNLNEERLMKNIESMSD